MGSVFVLAVGIAAGLGNSVSSVIIATGSSKPAVLCATDPRRRQLSLSAYVEAAGLAGFSPFAIVALHIMPAWRRPDGAIVAPTWAGRS